MDLEWRSGLLTYWSGFCISFDLTIFTERNITLLSCLIQFYKALVLFTWRLCVPGNLISYQWLSFYREGSLKLLRDLFILLIGEGDKRYYYIIFPLNTITVFPSCLVIFIKYSISVWLSNKILNILIMRCFLMHFHEWHLYFFQITLFIIELQ